MCEQGELKKTSYQTLIKRPTADHLPTIKGQLRITCQRLFWKHGAQVLEKVLTFLPIASVCQFRTVCKKWNTLLSSREFASKHARASPPNDEYVIVAARRDHVSYRTTGWEVLHIPTARYFILSPDFINGCVKPQLPEAGEPDETTTFPVAADGGPFCVVPGYTETREGVNFELHICNSVLKAVKRLPDIAPLKRMSVPNVTMTTDKLSMDYEICFLDCEVEVGVNFTNSRYLYRVCSYESKTGRWKKSTIAPAAGHLNSYTAVVLNKKVFFLSAVEGERPRKEGVVSYDEMTGAWCKLRVQLSCGGESGGTRLVVSGGRLFYVVIDHHTEHTDPSLFRMSDQTSMALSIFEIDLAREECVRIAGRSLMPLLNILGRFIMGALPSDFTVAGCSTCILIFSLYTGKSLAFNVATRSWQPSPSTSPHRSRMALPPDMREIKCGSNHSLSLCVP